MEAILFLDVPGPGALARFVERRGAEDPAPVDIWLSDALGPGKLRALIGPAAHLAAWYAVFDEAFGPRLPVFERSPELWRAGKIVDGRISIDSEGNFPRTPWWHRVPGWPAPRDPLLAAIETAGLPGHRLRPPAREVDLGTVDLLDQRRLLVETVPVRYRLPLPRAPKVQ